MIKRPHFPREHHTLFFIHGSEEYDRAVAWVTNHTKMNLSRHVFKRRLELALQVCAHCKQYRMEHAGKKCLFEPTSFKDIHDV